MLDERLFYFIHGLATMYFVMAGLHRYRRQEASRLERLCGYILLYWAFLKIKDLFFYAEPIFRDNYLSNLLILIDMTVVPAGGCFIIELLNSGWCTLRRALWLAAPFLLAVLCYAVTDAVWLVNAFFIFVGCYTALFCIYIVYAVRRYNRLLAENYSNVERVHVRWLKGVTVMLVICLVVWSISTYFSSWVADSIYQVTLVSMWMVALYYADRQQTPQLEDEDVQPTDVNAPNVTEDLLSGTLLGQRLDHLMQEERVWLNPHLTLSELAMLVGTNRTYLSTYLNNTLHTTFYDYINGFRLEAVLQQLHEAESAATMPTMAEVAEACGFNSLSTFRRVFVRVQGCSFARYRELVGQEK